jgi:Predicted glutamine amidotransferases
MKPLIGINVDITSKPIPQVAVQLPYLEGVTRSGGIPILLPPMTDEDLATVVKKLDGIMFIGGCDYHPKRYNEEVDETCKLLEPRRDEFDFQLLEQALNHTNVPLLGICLGAQLINIGLGGSLVQDIKKHYPDSKVGHASPNGWENGFNNHDVILKKGTLVHEIYKTEKVNISTSHHQAVKEVGKGLEVSAHAEDGVIEAVELPGSRWVVGVQWHPERDLEGSKCLFDAFVKACRNGHN